ncbi:MAG: o-succinylbenzoate--CoA ligase [Chloroflexi bacterium]|nr:MAG: o-succinylbenzoate--CoA ligase [Chloroflexota bacterium]MBL1193447.1 o-succinylbenzoate--CoA ligase [Chloroflexota bacterium]NOH10738.1 o-succinylbenzoate--CoA ligase [Chloroflexota bacterium]
MQDWLAQRARSTPDKLALVFGDRQWTYSELDAWASNLAAYLHARGVETGQRVGVLLPNQPVFVALIHALVRLGAIQVPLNIRLTEEELSWQLKTAACEFLIVNPETQSLISSEIEVEILDLAEVPESPVSNLESLIDTFNPDRIHAIFFTSGTTGKPKGARLTFNNHFWSASASAYRLGVLPDDRWLLCMPLYHIGGQAIVLRSCLYGKAIELQDGFDVDAVYQSMANGQTTLVSLVPTMLHRILDKYDTSAFPEALRCILLGGAQTRDDLIARSHELGLPIALTYGLTEAASQVATALPEGVRRKPGSVGKPLMFTEITIQDEDGHKLSTNEIGEIIVSGPTVMAGYEGQSDADGSINTGDLGYLDEDGDLWVVNRRSDLIVSGGENVYPAEVEAALLKHPAVQEACVVGIDDTEWGQHVAVALVATDIDKDELLDFARKYLAGYKLPRTLVFVRKLPRTASGKVIREKVRQIINDEMMVTI